MTDLRERLDRDLADLRLPPGFEDGVLQQGRRLRRRRRATAVGGGLAAVVLGTAVTVVGGDSSSTDPGFAEDVPMPTAPATTDPHPTGWWDTPARRMLTTLEAALPEGVTVGEYDLHTEGEDGPQRAVGSLMGVLAADTGPGSFQIILYPPDPAGQPMAERIRCRTYMTTCEPILDGSGRVVGRVTTDTEQGTTLYEVALLGPDGGGLNLTVTDSDGEKPGYENPSASEPPLRPGELATLAQDPAWTAYVPQD